jgi:hypothetical protein
MAVKSRKITKALLSRTKIDRTGAVKTRTGSLFVRRRISGWGVWILIAAALLAGAIAPLILYRSYRDGAEPDSSKPHAPISPATTLVELSSNDRSALEKNNEPAITPSTVRTAQRDGSVSKTPIQPLLEETEADPVVKPLAFYNPPAEANWTEDQYQRLANLREEFAAALGGWKRNPSDPDYRALWMQAQPIIDEQFEAIFGVEAFTEQQNQATHQAE